jgi:pimeloyl-ACP methyl ester carboxylesterase
MTVSLQKTSTYVHAPNTFARGANGVDYAYRDLGESAVQIVLLQHFRGDLDNWDPSLVDALAENHRVVAFDNVGVGGSGGVTPSTVAEMARDAITFLDAMDFDQVDILGYSLGSFVAQEIALIRPEVVRRLVLASSAPEGGTGMHGWEPEVIAAIGKPQRDPNGYLSVFFTSSEASQQAGRETLQRISGARRDERDVPSTWQTRQAQYDAVCTWGIPDHARLERLRAIDIPVFIANGDSDPMILPHFSYLLAGLIPHAQVKIYPDAAHGFLFQHHAAFAADVAAFLDDQVAVDRPAVHA